MRPHPPILIKALVCAAALLGLVPAGANALTTVSYNSASGLSIQGDGGSNIVRVVVAFNGSNNVYRLFLTDGLALTGCTAPVTNQIDCSITGTRAISATLGDGTDQLDLDASSQPPGDVLGPTTVDAGAGDDSVSGTDALGNAVTANGGAGDDSVFGGGGADTLNAGPGNDLVGDGGGADTLNGGDGDDRLFASGTGSGAPEPTPQADSFDGAAGTDVMLYNFETQPVTISLDNTANDGRAGENDNALNMENVVGSRGPNTITGNSGPNTLTISALGSDNVADDVIRGGDGDDKIGGCKGDDQLFGEGGDDDLNGGSGTDTVEGGAGDDQLGDDNLANPVTFGPWDPLESTCRHASLSIL